MLTPLLIELKNGAPASVTPRPNGDGTFPLSIRRH